jgi:outer membrane biosynthesis protein TonB
MAHRLRTGWLAGTGALVLLLSLSGGVLGASLVTDTTAGTEATEPVDTTATFEDLDGNGIDDDCDEAVVANPEAAAAAFQAADLDADGTISVSEAAQTGWTGGANCNHGGYVTAVARADEAACEEPVVEEEPAEAIVPTADEPVEEVEEVAECEPAETEDDAAPAEEAVCEVVEAPEPDPALDPAAPNSHGAWVSWVAGSEAVGGKNCNHGGAVSEAAKQDQEAARAERDAAKAARAAERAERAAARELRAQEREAAKAARSAGKGQGKGH